MMPFFNGVTIRYEAGETPQEPTGDALWAWLDAADLTTITAESGRVTDWADKSGNGHYAYQVSGSAARPYTGLSTVNGLNVICFAGAQRLAFPASAFPNANGNNSILAVVKQDAGNTDTWIISGRNTSSISAYSLLANSVAQGGSVVAAWHNNTNLASEVVLGTPDDLPHIVGFVRDGANIKAVYDDALSAGRAAENVALSNNLYIGCRFSAAPYSAYFSGEIAEILIYDKALTASELTHNTSYLQSKWEL